MKTTIYIFCNIITILIGLILLVSYKQDAVWISISTSLVAGGLASLSFTIIYFFDEKSSKEQTRSTYKSVNVIRDDLYKLQNQLSLLQSSKIITDDPKVRCIFRRHCDVEYTNVLQSISSNESLMICEMGFTLFRFYKDQIQTLLSLDKVTVRLIVQDPTSPIFKLLTQQEGRDIRVMAQEILELTQNILNQQGKNVGSTNINLEIRWFSGSPSMTLSRINDVMFVRPRFLLEGRDAPVFYERYFRSTACFDIYMEYFENAWQMSKNPTTQDCNAVKLLYP